MTASIRKIGVLQPPVVREVAEGLMTNYGHRRVRGSIAAKRFELQVLVLGADEDAERRPDARPDRKHRSQGDVAG